MESGGSKGVFLLYDNFWVYVLHQKPNCCVKVMLWLFETVNIKFNKFTMNTA
jgi:hypothetical protein